MKALPATRGVNGTSGNFGCPPGDGPFSCPLPSRWLGLAASAAQGPAFRRFGTLAVCHRRLKRRQFDQIGLNLTKFDPLFYFSESEAPRFPSLSHQIRPNPTVHGAPLSGPGAIRPLKANQSKSNLQTLSNSAVLRQNGTKLRRAFEKSRLIKVNQGFFYTPPGRGGPGSKSFSHIFPGCLHTTAANDHKPNSI